MKKILAAFLAAISLFALVSCGERADRSELDWPDGELANMIPQIEGAKGALVHENSDSLYIQLEKISENEYSAYIEECQNRGFSVDVSETVTELDEEIGFTAFDENGYKVEILYFSSGDMWILVNSPMPMSDFDWPDNVFGKLLPEPASHYGKIEWVSKIGFVIYVGNTTKEEYRQYVDCVYACGFTIDSIKEENRFYACNAYGDRVNVRYEGFDIMYIRIDGQAREVL